MKFSTSFLVVISIIASMLWSGCVVKSPEPISPTLSRSSSPPQPTHWFTLNPSSTTIPHPTRTPKPTGTPTWVPLPTLPPAEALAKVQELLETNGGCELPCWWGITPGKTTWKEAFDFLQPLAWKISDPKNHPVYLDKITREFYFAYDNQPSLMNSLMAIFVLDRDTLSIEWIITANPHDLKNFFVDYGNPEEIWIHLTGIWTGPVEFTVKMFYPDKGIMGMISNYAERVRRNGEDFVGICKKSLINQTGGIVVWSPDEKKEFLDFFREYEETYRYKPIEEVLSMSPEEFTRFILEAEDDQCLETPLSIWEE